MVFVALVSQYFFIPTIYFKFYQFATVVLVLMQAVWQRKLPLLRFSWWNTVLVFIDLYSYANFHEKSYTIFSNNKEDWGGDKNFFW